MVNGRNKGAAYERKMAQELFLQLVHRHGGNRLKSQQSARANGRA